MAERIYADLTDVTPLFDDFGLEKIVDTWSRDRQMASDQELSLENGNVPLMGLRLRLNGFQAGGRHTFDLSKDLVFNLEYTSYTVGPDKNTQWLEKPYLEPWSTSELDEVAAQWVGLVIEEITQKVQELG
nr:hypothetical protein [Rufibacter sp. SYSU D00308]